jgi:hypothetical protein
MRRKSCHYNKDAVIFDLSPPLLSPLGTDANAVQGWLDTWDGPDDQAWRDIELTVSNDIDRGDDAYRQVPYQSILWRWPRITLIGSACSTGGRPGMVMSQKLSVIL